RPGSARALPRHRIQDVEEGLGVWGLGLGVKARTPRTKVISDFHANCKKPGIIHPCPSATPKPQAPSPKPHGPLPAAQPQASAENRPDAGAQAGAQAAAAAAAGPQDRDRAGAAEQPLPRGGIPG